MTWTPAPRSRTPPWSAAPAVSSTTSTRCPGTLVAAIVRSPHPHARIRGVDLARARAHPGVAAVIGPEEVGAAVRPFPLSTSKAPMPYLPDRHRHRALRRRARRGGRGRRPLRRRGRRRARRGRLRAARRRRRHPRGARARGAPCCTTEAGTNVATDRTFSFGAGRRRLRARRPRRARRVHVPALLLGADGVLRRRGAVARRVRRAPPSSAWANFHGPFTMVPVVAGSPRRARSRGSGCTCRPTSAAASASSRASTPTSC